MKDSLKIAYCIPSLHHAGGMERVLTFKANYFADVLGYDISIITTDGKGLPPFFPLSPKIHVIELDVKIDKLWMQPLWKRFPLFIIRLVKYKKELSKCLFRIKPDITVSMLRREINFINLIKDGSIKLGEMHFTRYGYRQVNSKYLPAFINRWLSNLWLETLTYNLKRLSRFIVLSYEDKALWKGLNNIEMIYNPLTISHTKVSDCSSKKAITAGRYATQKGFDYLIDAWSEVQKKHPDWELHIYGGGDNQLFQNMANEKGVGKTLTCHPAVSNIEEKFAESSFFILSSRFEGFGLVLVEAMSCGLPLVSFDCPCGPKEIIEEGVDGCLVELKNVHQLADRICFMIENEEKRKLMGKMALQNVERFKIENIALQWQKLFKQVLSEKVK